MSTAPTSLKEISDLLKGELSDSSQAELAIHGVVDSGLHTASGSIFVAISGTASDGHDYIEQAFLNGAVAAVVTDPERLEDRPGIVVENSRRALSRLAGYFCGDPSQTLLTLGVTGTNGKTTVHFLLHQLLGLLQRPGVRIGTLGTVAPGVIDEPGALTTPSALEVQQGLSLVVSHGLTSAVVETSSHALHQFRIEDVWYDIGVFTNLAPDHLDYHYTMEEYFQSKLHLFRKIADTKKSGVKADFNKGAVVCIDCEYGLRAADHARSLGLSTLTYGEHEEADVRIIKFEQELQSSELTLRYQGIEKVVKTRLLGAFNGANLCSVFAVGVLLGYRTDQLLGLLGELSPVTGRMEPVGNERVAVFVDYSHTPHGLENALHALRGVVKNRLWVVFGFGGDRPPGRRVAGGRVAQELADCIVVTSDNPRTEDPQKIIDEILSSGCNAMIVEVDRRKAIRETMEQVLEGDVVLIAGKGHEDYQIIGTEKFHFSDQEEVLKLKEEGVF